MEDKGKKMTQQEKYNEITVYVNEIPHSGCG
jgi:hypothetical protein